MTVLGATTFDINAVRQDFPSLHQEINGKPLVYLDNAATAQKPRTVIDALDHYYRLENSNVHRGVHTLSQQATAAYEQTRRKIQRLINAASDREIIFTKGTTESINLVAYSYLPSFLERGDEILVTEMEHHANIVPWQLVGERIGVKLRPVPVNDDGEVDMDAYRKLLTPKVKLVGMIHVSNALGTINPAKEMIALAHEHGAKVLVDGAQAVPHMEVDVQDLDADFYVFSGHKLFGPTGIGVLYGKEAILEQMPPFHGGGDMIDVVTFDRTTYAELPGKFEAGTPPIASGICLGAAIDYVNTIGYEAIQAQEHKLLEHATERVQEIDGLRIIGTAKEKAAVVSFVMKDIHPHDLGTLLDQQGVAIRTGHHCAQPLMQRYDVPATGRASFAFYNTIEEVDLFVDALHKAKELFA